MAAFDDALSVFRLPVLGPVFVHHLDFAVSDKRLQHVVLAFLEEDGVVIGLRAVDADELLLCAAFLRPEIGQVAGLQLADFHVIEGEVQVEVAAGNQAIVGEDGDAGFVRLFHRTSHRGAVVRDDDEGIDAAGDQ